MRMVKLPFNRDEPSFRLPLHKLNILDVQPREVCVICDCIFVARNRQRTAILTRLEPKLMDLLKQFYVFGLIAQTRRCVFPCLRLENNVVKTIKTTQLNQHMKSFLSLHVLCLWQPSIRVLRNIRI